MPIQNQVSLGDCTDWFTAATSPACWYAANVNAILGTNPADDAVSCAQAAGGSTTSQAYLNCIAAKQAVPTQMAQSDPTGASDYNALTTNPLDLLNPFTGSGPLNPANGINWTWLALGGLAFLFWSKGR